MSDELDKREVALLIEALDTKFEEDRRHLRLDRDEVSEVKKLVSKMHDVRRALDNKGVVLSALGPLKLMRCAPAEIEEQLPPHRIEFHPEDPNLGRSCARCGFAVPRGCRYVHADWCEKRA